jgi:hypothetical protein
MTSSEKPSQISELLLDRLAADTDSWVEKGACVEAGIDPFDPRKAKAMQALCESCPVFDKCAEYRDDKLVGNGVWAGAVLTNEEVKSR